MTKILLVEDDKSLREIYSVRLLAEGYTLVSFGDGEEALAAAISEKPDLIISDVMMPKISGFEMLDLLRSNESTKNIPVIILTALSSEQQRERSDRLGADRYLIKSQVGIEDIVHTVHEVLGDKAMPAPSIAEMQSSLNQANSQPTNQPTNQPMDQPVNQPANQPTNQPVGQPDTLPTNQPMNQPVNQPADQPMAPVDVPSNMNMAPPVAPSIPVPTPPNGPVAPEATNAVQPTDSPVSPASPNAAPQPIGGFNVNQDAPNQYQSSFNPPAATAPFQVAGQTPHTPDTPMNVPSISTPPSNIDNSAAINVDNLLSNDTAPSSSLDPNMFPSQQG